MTSSKLPLVVLLIVLMGATVFFLIVGGKDDAPMARLPVAEAPSEPRTAMEATEAPREPEASAREAVAAGTDAPSSPSAPLDPELRAEMAGFVGRVLHHDGQPAAETKVVLYHFDPSGIMGEIQDLLSEESIDPDVDAGDAMTDAEGRFELRGVWPRSLYLLNAGVDGGNPTTMIIERTPRNREVIDLGDIHLRDGAIVTGVVVGEDDAPVAGALVRVVDIPAQIFQMVPIERFDPDGAMIVRDGASKFVVNMPAWVKKRFDKLPLPTTRTAADGSFRVTGIEAGNNHVVAVTKPGHLSALQPGLTLRAGVEKDVGQLRLDEGEEVFGSVTDSTGQPVVGAEVLVGQSGAVTDACFAAAPLRSGSDGSFTTTGFNPGKVVAAARRHPGDPWVITEPQSVMSDLAIVLPRGMNLTVRLSSKAGRVITEPELQLLNGGGGGGAVMLKRFGFSPPIDLGARQQTLEDGRLLLAGLPAGQYTLLARAHGHALTGKAVNLTTNEEITLELDAESGLMVRVTDRAGQPVRAAAIYAGLRDNRRRELGEMPLHCGRTTADGRLAAGGIAPGNVRISARHPRYGWVHADARVPGPEVQLVFDQPGAIEGVLTEKSQIPEPGKWTIAANREGEKARGSMPEMPRLTTADAEGHFSIQGLQPGEYTLTTLESLSKYKTPGSFLQNMFMARMADMNEMRYVVVAGQTTHVTLDTEKLPGVVDGPSARITGTILINGQPAANLVVTGWGNGQIRGDVDAAGRFDLGQVQAGHLYLQVMDPTNADLISRGELWSQSLQIEENKDQDLQISLETASLAGRVTNPDGTPATGTQVHLSGSVGTDHRGRASFRSLTDDQGQFAFPKVPTGQYNVHAEREDVGQGWSDPVAVSAGHHRVDIQLTPTVAVSGRVDRRAFGDSVGGLWLTFAADNNSQAENWIGIDDDGSFEIGGLVPGTYRARVWANYEGSSSKEFEHSSPIHVGPAGLQGVVLDMKVVEGK